MKNDTAGKHGGDYRIDPHDLDLVAVGSDPAARARERIFDVDTAMRGNYDALRAKVAANLSPVIVIQPDLGGGSYTLVWQGKQTTTYPVSHLFQMVKSISHLPLGIYAILAPYLKGARTTDWAPDLAVFRDVAAAALASVGQAKLPPRAERACVDILSKAIDFMDRTLEEGDFTIAGFKQFSSSAHESILINMSFAAEALVSGIEPRLAEWREEMGEQAWKDLYVVILAIWTTESQNQHYEILKRVMYQKTVAERLIVIAVGEQEPDMLGVALDNLARIVQDNVAAGLILPTDAELARTLAGTKDLLADAVDKVMQSCPRSAPHRRR
ncbi:MAG TPA: hypothetical protein VF650_07775 [Allosphingosinicella sp.]|jgi:hypothetical protein